MKKVLLVCAFMLLLISVSSAGWRDWFGGKETQTVKLMHIEGEDLIACKKKCELLYGRDDYDLWKTSIDSGWTVKSSKIQEHQTTADITTNPYAEAIRGREAFDRKYGYSNEPEKSKMVPCNCIVKEIVLTK